MNIQAVNANSTLGRRRVPSSNNVSFQGGAEETVEAAAKGVKNAASSVVEGVKDAAPAAANSAKGAASKVAGAITFAGSKALSGAKTAGGAIKKGALKAKDTVAEFVAKNKGAKGVKIAATALTAAVATGFAVKELYDIITKSNSER